MTDAVTTAAQITEQVSNYGPLVVAGVQAAEQSDASGENKKQAVLDGIGKASEVMTSIPVPQVQVVGAMIEMFVGIFNALGIFKKKPKV